MRHNKSGKRLGRTWSHRKAMFRNMAKSLIIHGRIKTTETKAKELRSVADKLVTLALRNDLHARRQAYKVLADHQLVKKLFDEIGPRFADAGGGYTRVVKLAVPRAGDCAPMALIEFTRNPDETPRPKKSAATAPGAEAAAPVAAAPESEAAAPEAEAAAPEAEAAAPEAEAAAPESEAAAPEAEAAAPEAEAAAPEAEAAPESEAEPKKSE